MVKAKIVSEYFPKYCKILRKGYRGAFRYTDLFAGPGMYKEGKPSTPLLIGRAVSDNSDLRGSVSLVFNDNEYAEALEENFLQAFPLGTFARKVFFLSHTVGDHPALDEYLERGGTVDGQPIPTLLFVDPFGYKAVNTALLAKFLKSFGNEIFLFVNIKRIHAAIENQKFDELMRELFPSSFELIKQKRLYTASVRERLTLILDSIESEFKKFHADELFVTPFEFKEEDSSATSHYILHFTKHKRGYDLIKQIYHDFDNVGASLSSDGRTYTFDAKRLEESMEVMFDLGDPNIEQLAIRLNDEYRGRTISAKSLFEEHQVKTKYSRRHYTEALRQLVQLKKLASEFKDSINHEVSVLISDNCILKFA